MNQKQFAINLAKQAGQIIVKYFNIDHQRKIKSDDSPVTLADTTINQLVVDEVKKQFPDHGCIIEEGGTFNEKNELVWVCDPLDGTIPFTHGLPTCVFSLALVQNGDPVLGVVYNPFADRLYYAEKSKGAYLNNKPIHVGRTKKLRRSFIGICVWDTAYYDFTGTLEELVKIGVDFETGPAAYLGVLVASGDAVASLFPHTSPWDVAAVKIIVEQAGGKVTDIYGQNQKYNQKTKGNVASNGLVHEQIIAIVQKTINKK